MTSSLAVLDIQRIGWGALKAHAKHERREIGDRSHTDPSQTPRNRATGLDKCPEEAVKQYLEQTDAKIDKRNEKPFTRLLLSASPEYFRPGRAGQGGSYDTRQVKAWTQASLTWLRKEFGSDLVHVALHLDETTPHMHAVVVPTYEKQTKRRTVRQISHHKHPAFAGENSYEACHDRYAAAVQDLGIERGERLPDGAKRKSHKTKRQWLGDALRRFQKSRRKIEQALLGQRKRLEADRKTFKTEKDRAEPALMAAQRVAERLGDATRSKELQAHLKLLKGSHRHIKERQRGRALGE